MPSLFGPTRFAATGLLAAVLVAGCSDTTSPRTEVDASGQLSTVATNVILATYTDMDAKAVALQAAVATLTTTPTEPNLAAAQLAWRNARKPWEQSEAFLFGPVETQGIDPSIDSWPVNVVDLDAVLAGNDPLDKAHIDALEGTLKGFHTIEYLLFGVDESRTAASFTARELEYLNGVTASYRGATQTLATTWAGGGGDFVSQLANAGQGSTIYASQSAALQELVNGMIGICDEVANGKIADPFVQQDRTLEESQFSNNSNNDFADNLRSVRNVYLGTLDGSAGQGLTVLVGAKNPALDAQVKNQLTVAISAIQAMTPTFGDAIFNNAIAVEAAQEAIRNLKTTLEGQVLPLVTGL